MVLRFQNATVPNLLLVNYEEALIQMWTKKWQLDNRREYLRLIENTKRALSDDKSATLVQVVEHFLPQVSPSDGYYGIC